MKYSNPDVKRRLLYICITVSAVLYSCMMLKLLIFRGSYYDEYIYNVVPFRTIQNLLLKREYYDSDNWYKNLFGNIILFIPLGIYFPLWNKRYEQISRLALAVIKLIFVVECTQLLTKVGSFDIDDIILNTLGAVIGLFVLKGIRFIYRL